MEILGFLTSLLAHPPYKMVVVSIISLVTYLAILFTVRFIYPRKKIPYVLILLGFSILPLISVLREGTYESGDINIHITNTMSFYRSLENGIYFPVWAEQLNANYGYPVFGFIYPLPYYIASLYRFIGFSFVDSVKLLLASTYAVSGTAMYFWLNKHVNNKSAFVGSMLYLFAPYHLLDLHFRSAVGEMTALLFLPLSLLLLHKFNKKLTYLYCFLSSVSVALLIMSHPAVSLLGLPILMFYSVLISRKNPKSILLSLFPIFLGILISSYYWLPVFFEAKFTHQTTQVQRVLEFPAIGQLFYSYWKYGFLHQGPDGQLTYTLGYANWIAILVSLYLILLKRKLSKYFYFLFVSFILYFILINSISMPVWKLFSILRKMQFPYRILSILILLSSALSSTGVNILKSKLLFYFILSLSISVTILNWGNRKNTPNVKDREIRDNMPLSTAEYAGVAFSAPIWIPGDNLWKKTIPENSLESLGGNIDIISEERKINEYLYVVSSNKPTLVKQNTYYFPGWKLEIDGKPSDIVFTNDAFPGIITFPLEEGIHYVRLTFEQTPIRYYSLLFSGSILLLSGSSLLFKPLFENKWASTRSIKDPASIEGV